MTQDNTPQFVGVNHVGLYAHNPAVLAEFYQDLMGMQLVGSSDENSRYGATAFLSSRLGDDFHVIALLSNPDLGHTAFKVGSLAELRNFYQRVVERGISVKMAVNHGVSLAFYFNDPEDNLIEIYWPTDLHYGQPYGHAIDLTLSEEALRQDVADLAARVVST